MKKYGRKIKRSKNLYKRRKSPLRTGIEIAVMFVVVAALGFVGWHAGKAIQDYFREAETRTVPDDIDLTPPLQTEAEPVSAVPPDDEPDLPVFEDFNAIFAPLSVLDNTTSLSAYIQQVKNNGYDAVVLELKDGAGYLYYKSEYEPIRDSDIIRGGLSAAEIFSAFENTGVRPIARINTLSDRLSPSVLADVSYVFAAGGGRWLDDRPDNDGKLWANPFLQGTRDYNAFLVKELSGAGFTEIILANVIFPNFRAYDFGVLASEYTAPATRFEGLVGFISASEENRGGAKLIIEMNIKDVVENYAGFNNSAELLRGRRDLADLELLLFYGKDDFGEEYKTGESSSVVLPSNDIAALINVVFKQAGNVTSGARIVPGLNKDGLSDREIADILTAFGELGFESFIIR